MAEVLGLILGMVLGQGLALGLGGACHREHAVKLQGLVGHVAHSSDVGVFGRTQPYCLSFWEWPLQRTYRRRDGCLVMCGAENKSRHLEGTAPMFALVRAYLCGSCGSASSSRFGSAASASKRALPSIEHQLKPTYTLCDVTLCTNERLCFDLGIRLRNARACCD